MICANCGWPESDHRRVDQVCPKQSRFRPVGLSRYGWADGYDYDTLGRNNPEGSWNEYRAKQALSSSPDSQSDRMREIGRKLLEMYDQYQDSDLNYECAHTAFVGWQGKRDTWEALRQALQPEDQS